MGKLLARCTLIFVGLAIFGFILWAFIQEPQAVGTVLGSVVASLFGLWFVLFGIPYLFEKAGWGGW